MNLQKRNHSDIYQQVLQNRKQLRAFATQSEDYPSPNDIHEVIVILGSSRSGSSLLHHLLSQHPDLISLQGEEVAFTKLYGLNEINSFQDSDCLPSGLEINWQELAAEMLCDAGYQDQNSERLAVDRAQRLLVQWPQTKFSLKDLYLNCQQESWEKIISSLKKIHPEISLSRYDHFQNSDVLPLENLFIEEPPFIMPKPKSYKTNSSRKKHTLLLKSSINAFRSEILQKLFPKAEIKYVHLTRHPAASINGLIDGWKSDAFHSHRLDHLVKLKIEGYENQAWWKFDLPPGWIEFVNRPLVEVCAFQWKAANRSIAHFLNNKNPAGIKYENLLSLDEMKKNLKEVCLKLNLSSDFLKDLTPPPVVMGVVTPDQHHWKEKADLINPVLHEAELSSLASELGYKKLL